MFVDHYDTILKFLQIGYFQYIIFIIALFLLVLELLTPGFALFGTLGTLLLLLWIVEANMFSWAYLLALVGLGLIVLDLIIAFTGFFFALGVLCILSGFMSAMYVSVLSTNWVLFTVLLILLIALCFGFYLAVRKILSLKKEKTQFFVLEGQKGIVLEDVNEKGQYQCRVDGVIWNAFSKDPLKKGDTIKVLSTDSAQTLLEVQKENA